MLFSNFCPAVFTEIKKNEPTNKQIAPSKKSRLNTRLRSSAKVNAATITAKGIANALNKLPESGKILTEICN